VAPEPGSQALERLVETRRVAPRTEKPQGARRAVESWLGAADEPVADGERRDVAAICALRLRVVRLEPVADVEQRLGAVAVVAVVAALVTAAVVAAFALLVTVTVTVAAAVVVVVVVVDPRHWTLRAAAADIRGTKLQGVTCSSSGLRWPRPLRCFPCIRSNADRCLPSLRRKTCRKRRPSYTL